VERRVQVTAIDDEAAGIEAAAVEDRRDLARASQAPAGPGAGDGARLGAQADLIHGNDSSDEVAEQHYHLPGRPRAKRRGFGQPAFADERP
jgi:hypothetical protein